CGVPGAHNLALLATAFGERRAAMRTDSGDGVDLARVVENGDGKSVERNLLTFACGNLRHTGNGGKGHRPILTGTYGYCGDRRAARQHGALAGNGRKRIDYLSAPGGGGRTIGAVELPGPAPGFPAAAPPTGPLAGVGRMPRGGVAPLLACVSQPLE